MAVLKNTKAWEERTDNKRRRPNRNSDRLVFFLTVVASLIFWFLIKLSDNYSESYTFLLHYKNTPVNKQITTLIDSTLTVTISTNGYNILENQIKSKLHSVTINLKRCKLLKEKKNVYSIKSGDIKLLLSEYLGIPESQLTINKPDVHFILEKLKKKKVAVTARTNFGFKSQYGLYAIKIVPASVMVYGPPSILDTLTTLSTQRVKREDLSKNTKILCKIDNPSPTQLNLIPPTVHLNLDVEKYTEASMEIRIDVSHIKVNIRTFPSSVKVYYHVAVKDYNSVHPKMFTIEPDLQGIELSKYKKLKLKLTRKPDFVSQIRMDPTVVEFIIVK